MVLHVLLPPEENAFENDLHEESIDNGRSRFREFSHLNDLDRLGVLCDERQGNKPSFPVIMFRGRPAARLSRTYDRKKE